jgi:Putative transmembrane protein (Alph_Pro_TM)
VSALLFIGLLCAVVGRQPAAVRVTPRVIEVGAFYDGARVRVEGAAAPRSKVIVAITGSDREERFKRKERFGPFWMSAERVQITGAPLLFLRFSAEPVAALLDRETIARLHLDEASVRARIHIEPPPPDPATAAALRSAFLALKKSRRTYAFGDGGISMGMPAGDCVPYTLEFHWPKKAPPARYTVHVYEVRDGGLVNEASAPLTVVRTGFPAWMAGLAENRASLYGMTAIWIGALAGFGIDFLTTRLFGKKRLVAH